MIVLALCLRVQFMSVLGVRIGIDTIETKNVDSIFSKKKWYFRDAPRFYGHKLVSIDTDFFLECLKKLFWYVYLMDYFQNVLFKFVKYT